MGQKDWVININERLSNMAITSVEMDLWKKKSIYKVASHVTWLNKKAYKPQVVSFGPYHHGEEHLKPMEEHKHRALLHFLKRSNKPLESYVESLTEIVQDLKDSYDSLDRVWQEDTPTFLQLMILDGCFMLEILRAATENVDDYAANDPIFSYHGYVYIMPFFKYDILMLENQLPLLVLEKLLAVENAKEIEDDNFVNKLILQFCCGPYMSFSTSMGKCLHVLDVYRKNMLGEDPRRKHPRQTRIPRGGAYILEPTNRSVTRLIEAGIQFKRSGSERLTDISFRLGPGELLLPTIVVNDTTESMFLNQIAFERYHVGAGNEVSTYIFFMNSLIYDAKDASQLHSCGIIHNTLGNDEAVAKIFNSLAKDITPDPENGISKVYRSIDRYCGHQWNVWRVNFLHSYFTNPWPILFAANTLFVLSIIQTFYTVYGIYYKN